MSDIVYRLRAVDGADARVIAHLESLDFMLEYVRDDVETEYSDRDFDEAYRLIMANQVSGDNIKKLVGRDFEAQALLFEDILVLVLPSARYEAIFASFDRDGTLPIGELVAVAAESNQ